MLSDMHAFVTAVVRGVMNLLSEYHFTDLNE